MGNHVSPQRLLLHFLRPILQAKLSPVSHQSPVPLEKGLQVRANYPCVYSSWGIFALLALKMLWELHNLPSFYIHKKHTWITRFFRMKNETAHESTPAPQQKTGTLVCTNPPSSPHFLSFIKIIWNLLHFFNIWLIQLFTLNSHINFHIPICFIYHYFHQNISLSSLF